MRAEFLWFALVAFCIFCALVFAAVYFKDVLRAGCETPFGKFFIEARGWSRKTDGTSLRQSDVSGSLPERQDGSER